MLTLDPIQTHATRGRARWTIGDLARAYGVSRESLRHWERRGSLPPARRTPGGHRRYGHEHAEALERILGPARHALGGDHD